MLNSTEIIALMPSGYLALAGIPLIISDITQRRLPNKIVLPLMTLSFICLIWGTAVSGNWLLGLFSFLITFAMFVGGMSLNFIGALGMGDVKLITAVILPTGLISLWLPLVIVGVALVAGVLIGLAIVAFTRNRNYSLPLGAVVVPVALLSTAFMAFSG